MSHRLYTVRLYWDGRAGIARHDGVEVVLREPPQPLPTVHHIQEMDYAPEARVAQLRESACSWRDLTREEMAVVDQWLGRLSTAARTLVVAR